MLYGVIGMTRTKLIYALEPIRNKLYSLDEKRFNKNGFLEIFINDKWILEHVYTIENHLGRKLRKNETIRHLDGNKLNNNLNNLILYHNQK
jgi:hypothetical protein